MRFVILTVVVSVVPALAHARTPNEHPIEVGAFLGALDVRDSQGEKPLTLGLRGGYRLFRYVVVEGEWLNCPTDPSNNFGQRVLLAGPKIGARSRPLSVLGKVRVGTIRLGPHYAAYNGGQGRTEPAIDVGAVFELEVSRRGALRIDMGGLIVPYGDEPIRGPLPPHSKVLGTTVNPIGSIGFQLRF